MTDFKKAGEIMNSMGDGPMMAQILKIINLPPKEKAKFHRDVKRDMQLGVYNSQRTGRKDYIQGVDVWFTYSKENNKTVKDRHEVDRRWVFRETDDGYTVMMNQRDKSIRPAGCRRVYDLKREKDGYEWLKLCREKGVEYKDVVFGDEKKPVKIKAPLAIGQETAFSNKKFIGETEDGIF